MLYTDFLKRYSTILLFLVSLIWLLKALLLPGYPDFKVNYFGALHIIRRENPYLPDKNYFTDQVYPPLTMILFFPLTIFTPEIASKLWTIISILSILGSIYICCRIYKIRFFSTINLFLSTLIFLAFPVKFTLGMGQVNNIILLLVTATLYFLNTKRNILAGVLLANTLIIKFFPILLLPYLLFSKKWKLLITLLITLILLMIITLLFVPFSTTSYFYQHILSNLLSSWKGDYYNQALTGLLMRNIADPSLRESLRIIIPLILLSINFFVLLKKGERTQRKRNLEIASLVILNVLINNFSWQHHYVFLILPFLVITYTLRKFRTHKFFYIPLAVSYVLVSINFKDPRILPLLLQSHVFFGGLILWFVSIYILYRYKL